LKILFVLGVILLLLGIVSLFVAIPVKEKQGIKAGGLSVGIETVERQKVRPAVSAVLIGGGVVLLLVGKRR